MIQLNTINEARRVAAALGDMEAGEGSCHNHMTGGDMWVCSKDKNKPDELCLRLFPKIMGTNDCPCGVYDKHYIKRRTVYYLRDWNQRIYDANIMYESKEFNGEMYCRCDTFEAFNQ